MNRILITGVDSFIGKTFRKYSKYRSVREISLIDTKPEEINYSEFDTILHLAAIVHRSKKIQTSEYFRINTDLSIRIAEEAKKGGVSQFIFLSSSRVYGKYNSGPETMNEDSICNPEDAYGKSKYEAELALKKLEDHGFVVSIVRTPIVYGEGVKANMRNLIKLVDSFPFLPFAGINNIRNYTYSENLTGFIDRIIEKKASGIFIAMDDNPISTTELISYLSIFMKRKLRLFRLPGFCIKSGYLFFPKFFVPLFGSYILDNTRTKALLDYKPPFSTEEGIRRMISSYQANKK